MANNSATVKSPEERQAIWDAVTTDERLKATKDRMSPGASSLRKSLSIAAAFSKGTPVYTLIEKMIFYFGYPVGGEINEKTGRVQFKLTKGLGIYNWRGDEWLSENVNDVLRSIVTAVVLSEDPELHARVKEAVAKSEHVRYDSLKPARKFFDYLDRYLKASKKIRDQERLDIVIKALEGLSEEQQMEVIARRMPGILPAELNKSSKDVGSAVASSPSAV